MPCTPIYPDSFRAQVREFLDGYRDDVERAAAEITIPRHFETVLTNPRIGTSEPGLFETMPIYRFSIDRNGMRCAASIMYEHDRGKNTVEFLGFTALPVAPA